MKVKSILAMLLVLLILAGCGTKYEDTNGDDNYELQTITDEMFFGNLSASSSGGSESERFGVYKKSVNRLDGVMNIVDFSDYVNDRLTLTISFHITKGNGKMILCTNEKVIAVVETNKDDQVFNFSLDDMIYLRMAGEACAFDIEYTLSAY